MYLLFNYNFDEILLVVLRPEMKNFITQEEHNRVREHLYIAIIIIIRVRWRLCGEELNLLSEMVFAYQLNYTNFFLITYHFFLLYVRIKANIKLFCNL